MKKLCALIMLAITPALAAYDAAEDIQTQAILAQAKIVVGDISIPFNDLCTTLFLQYRSLVNPIVIDALSKSPSEKHVTLLKIVGGKMDVLFELCHTLKDMVAAKQSDATSCEGACMG